MDWQELQGAWKTWAGNDVLKAVVVVLLIVPVVLLAWYYLIRFFRWLLDGVISWGIWLFKWIMVGIVVIGGGGLLIFNVYQFYYYRHMEPMYSIINNVVFYADFMKLSWNSGLALWHSMIHMLASIKIN